MVRAKKTRIFSDQEYCDPNPINFPIKRADAMGRDPFNISTATKLVTQLKKEKIIRGERDIRHDMLHKFSFVCREFRLQFTQAIENSFFAFHQSYLTISEFEFKISK